MSNWSRCSTFVISKSYYRIFNPLLQSFVLFGSEILSACFGITNSEERLRNILNKLPKVRYFYFSIIKKGLRQAAMDVNFYFNYISIFVILSFPNIRDKSLK